MPVARDSFGYSVEVVPRSRFLARGIYDSVHADATYDLVVDTTHASTDECARAVLAFVADS